MGGDGTDFNSAGNGDGDIGEYGNVIIIAMVMVMMRVKLIVAVMALQIIPGRTGFDC